VKKSKAFAGINKLNNGKCDIIYKALIIPHSNYKEADITILAINVPITIPLLPESAVFVNYLRAAFAALFEDN